MVRSDFLSDSPLVELKPLRIVSKCIREFAMLCDRVFISKKPQKSFLFVL